MMRKVALKPNQLDEKLRAFPKMEEKGTKSVLYIYIFICNFHITLLTRVVSYTVHTGFLNIYSLTLNECIIITFDIL